MVGQRENRWLTWEPPAGFSSLAVAILSSRPHHQSDTLGGPLQSPHTHSHVTTFAAIPLMFSVFCVCVLVYICVLTELTVPFFNDPEGLKLQLHVLLDHKWAKYLEIICSQNWHKHRLKDKKQLHMRPWKIRVSEYKIMMTVNWSVDCREFPTL